jgi:hypothetical protein
MFVGPKIQMHIGADFFRIAGFPPVAGCVDGTMIKVDAPTVNEEQFVDRHGNHSLNAMMVCGPDYSFYFVNSRWPGSVHDSRVLRTSVLHQRFEEGWRPFPGVVPLGKNTKLLDYDMRSYEKCISLQLGDSGYALKEWLMTPCNRNIHDPAVLRYNRSHKSTRRIVENAYGILKERFPCLNYMRLNPTYAGKVIMTCATLHNIATKDDFPVPPAAQAIEEEIVPVDDEVLSGDARQRHF